MNLKREINISKKFIIIMLLVNIIAIGLQTSYAYFQVNVIKKSVVVIKTAVITMSIESQDLNNNKTLSLAAGESKTVTLTITNESEHDALARLYYIGDITDITFESDTTFKDENEVVIGQINKGQSQELTITITNNTDSSATIELGAQEGLIGYDLPLYEGRKNISLYLPPLSGADYIISTLNTGGLVAINTDGELYDGTGEIREYRYSGPEVNNYVIFNDDGDSTIEVNELWRIIGVFKNSSDEWNLKLVRDTVLTSDEMPNIYLSKRLEKETTGTAYITALSGLANTEWGAEYFVLEDFLNTNSDTTGTNGYYATFNSNAKALIDVNYTYNLGKVGGLADDTKITYEYERTVYCATDGSYCNIWNGAIALLYPSDYGYTANNSYWSELLANYNSDAMNTSWLYKTSNHDGAEWLISQPGGGGLSINYASTMWTAEGSVTVVDPRTVANQVRPSFNLIADAMIDSNHEGSITDPYIVIE